VERGRRGGLVTLSVGVTGGPQEYREWAWPVAVMFAAGLVLNCVNAYMTVAARKIPEFYISNWYILGAFCFLTILFATAYVPLYQHGLGNVVIQGYYMHTAVGMWFTMLSPRHRLLRDSTDPRPPHLFLRARRPRFWTKHPLLHG